MLKYLIIQLDDTSCSFCHYPNGRTERKLLSSDTLKEAIFWAMKENLNVQFLYPDYELPEEYKEIINTIDHADIVSAQCGDMPLRGNADVVVFGSWDEVSRFPYKESQAYVVRTPLSELTANACIVKRMLAEVSRLNIVITDVEKFDAEAQAGYAAFLDDVGGQIVHEYESEHPVQFNLLTDRILLDGMNNCNAGVESVTLAPDGKYYVCPAFYIDGSEAVGDVANGLDIRNQQLYRLDHAPICRTCDAWQCRRCVWLNRNLTLEVNTPGREQCVMAHIERNASRKLLAAIRKIGDFMPGKEIPEIDYLDPFDKIKS